MKPGNALFDRVDQFKLNAARLAAHKSYKQTQIFLELATNSKNKAEFRKAAAPVINTFNRYQAAEYNTMIARARSVRQFARFQEESVRFPNIEWLRTRSANPRELHLRYVGLILPINHPFWNENQPGNLWNCKCDWRTTDKPVTGEPGKQVKPARGLEGNPYETGELITARHPYFKGAPAWVKDNSMLMLPNDLAFVPAETEHGTILVHRLQEKASETNENKIVASILLKRGYSKVKLLPKIYESEAALRLRYYGEKYGNDNLTKCPDCDADGTIIEFKKSHGSFKSIHKRIDDAAEKSDIVVLRFIHALPTDHFENIIRGKKLKYTHLKSIIVINGEEVLEY